MAKRKPYRFVVYLLARTAAALIYFLPRKVAWALARAAGRRAYEAAGRHREKAFENLRAVYGDRLPEEKMRQRVKEVFEHLAQTAVEVLQFPKLTLRSLERFVDTGEAFSLYESLLREGRGLISVTAHLGNWELLAAMFGVKGFHGAVVGRQIYYEPYNRWIVELRRSVNVRTIYRHDSAREILELLSRNEIVGLLPDQDIDSLRGVFVDFFARPAYTPVAPVRLSLASGAPIVVNFLIREPDHHYRFVLGEVLRPVMETTREEAVKKYTAAWMRVFEKVIGQYPEQWVWMHPRWKTQPERIRERVS